MANRYQYTNTLTTRGTKKRYLSSIIYPKIVINEIYSMPASSDNSGPFSM